jgi:SOS-response transcriptional repressor LexA
LDSKCEKEQSYNLAVNIKNMNKNNGLKEYFTEEIRTQIREMSWEDMKSLLKELESTPFWFAILKYQQNRVAEIQDNFIVIDPVKDPTKIAHYQGAITGILDLQDAVLTLKFESKKAENPKNKEETNKDELGGAYGVV